MRLSNKSSILLFSILLIPAIHSHSHTIPFTLKRGVPEIEVAINDSIRASFIIDTGADQVYIDKNFAEKHGLLSGGKMPMRPAVGINQTAEVFQIFMRKIAIGNITQSVVSAVVIELPLIIKDTSKGMPDGILGYAFLKSHNILLNYRDSTIEFDLSDSAIAGQKNMKVPFNLDRHLVSVSSKINDTVDAKMILDTGSSRTIFSPALANALKLKDSSEVSKIKLAGRVTTSNVKVLVRDINAIILASKSDDLDGILGTNFLLERRLIIDYQNSQLIIFANK